MAPPAALVPVKAFDAAKTRLAPTLDADARTALAQVMAERVLQAARPMPTFVACDDERVAAWALTQGARVVWTAGHDLNGSITAGIAAARALEPSAIVIAHGDLPLAQALLPLTAFPGVTLVPDRVDDGTNVVCIPAGAPFVPMYGRGSFARHRAQALERALPLRIARRPDLQWDVDEPNDLPTELVIPTPTPA